MTQILKQEFNETTISHIAVATPEYFQTSEEIERELSEIYYDLKLSKGRLEFLTGVTSRGFWPLATRPSDIATLAGEKLFNSYNIKREEIDFLIYSGVSRNALEPATASFVHANLKLKNHCPFFDLSNACLGMMDSLHIAANLLNHQIKKILIVSGEHASPLYYQSIQYLKNLKRVSKLNRKEMRHLLANFTLGSAGIATLICKSECPGLKINRLIQLTDSSGAHLCHGSTDGEHLMMQTDSEELMKRGLTLSQKLWSAGHQFLFPTKRPNLIFTHQVGSAHHKELLSTLELSDILAPKTFEKWGNTGSAALPLTIATHLFHSDRQKNIDNIALLAIGSGLSSMMLQGDYYV